MKRLAASIFATFLFLGLCLTGCSNREADRTQESPPATDSSKPSTSAVRK